MRLSGDRVRQYPNGGQKLGDEFSWDDLDKSEHKQAMGG